MVTVDDSSAAPMTATPCRCPLCFYNAMHMHSADYAVARPLSVVHRYCVETAKYSHTILVFPYKTSWHQFGNLTDSSFNLEKNSKSTNINKQVMVIVMVCQQLHTEMCSVLSTQCVTVVS